MLSKIITNRNRKLSPPQETLTSLIVVLAIVLGGSMISDFPPSFFKFFHTIIGQFLGFGLIFLYIYRESDVNLVEILIETIFAVFVIQLLRLIFVK